MSWVSIETINAIPSVTNELNFEQVEEIIESLPVSKSKNGKVYYRLSDVQRVIRDYADNGEMVIDFLRSNAISMNGNGHNFPHGCNGNMNGRNGDMNGRNGNMNGRNGDMNGRNGDMNGRNGGMNGRNGNMNGRNGGMNGRNGGMNGRNGGIMPYNDNEFSEYSGSQVHIVMDTDVFLKMLHHNQ